MKRILYISMVLLFGAISEASGQQLPQFTQFWTNPYLVNPAAAGSEDRFHASTLYRSQWSGITDAPRTYWLSLTAPSANRKMGYGGHIYTDVTGPTRRVGAQGAYSYHLQLNEQLRLGLGISAGIVQYTIDATQIELREDNDPAMQFNKRSEILPDGRFGAHLYHEDYFAGISIDHIFMNSIDYFYDEASGELAPHFNFIGGYNWEVSSDFTISPSVLVKYVDPTPVKADLSLVTRYRDMVWLGLTYRTNDAAAASLGYILEDYLMIHYAYDITVSEVRDYTGGTHEIGVGLFFGKEKSANTAKPTGN